MECRIIKGCGKREDGQRVYEGAGEKGRTCVKGKDSLTHVPINAIDING
jgi:hypothetical protein